MDGPEHNHHPILTPKFMSKQKEKRIRFPEQANKVLDEYCEVFGQTPVSAITPLIIRYLSKKLHRARRRGIYSVNTLPYTIAPPSTKTPKKRKPRASQIPDDFDPPKSISEEVGLNHQMALDAFIDWAKSSGSTKADWIATFRNACRGWIPERFPQAKLSNQKEENYL